MATPFLDNFTEASNTNLESHTPSGGTAWTLAGGAAGAAIVQGTNNALRSRSTTASYYTCDDQGSANQYVQARLKSLATGFPDSYVACRLVDASNFVGWRCAGTGSSGLRLCEVITGTVTDKYSFQGVDESVYRVEVDGTTARIYADTVQKGTDQTVASSTETSQGVRIGSDQTVDWIDDFEAGALGGGSPYSLTVTPGAFTLTGNATGLAAGRKLAAAAQTYALTGNATTLKYGRGFQAVAGSFALTGPAATLVYTPVGGSPYTMTAAVASFVLTGNAAGLAAGRNIAATTVAYTLTGNDCTFSYTSIRWTAAGSASGAWSDIADSADSWTQEGAAGVSWSEIEKDYVVAGYVVAGYVGLNVGNLWTIQDRAVDSWQ